METGTNATHCLVQSTRRACSLAAFSRRACETKKTKSFLFRPGAMRWSPNYIWLHSHCTRPTDVLLIAIKLVMIDGNRHKCYALSRAKHEASLLACGF